MGGEATIMLQDVTVIMGLPIKGQTVIGDGVGNWPALVHDLLGVWPENPQDPPTAEDNPWILVEVDLAQRAFQRASG